MSKSAKVIAAVVVACVLVIGIILWFMPNHSFSTEPSALTSSETSASTSLNSMVPTSATNATSNTPAPDLVPSLADTQIDCALVADAQGKLVVDQNIKNCFEYFLTQMGERTLPQIDQQIRAYIQKNLPTTAATQATDLWQRYLRYKEAQNTLDAPKPDQNNPEQIIEAVNAIHQLRGRFFSPVEIDALFGDDIVYDQYTIDRIKIINNKSLSGKEKAKKLNQRIEQLPPELQKNLQEMGKLNDLRALTQDIKNRNGSATELRQMREQLVGAPAADRLEQLDRTRAQWQTKVDAYLAQREQILKSPQAKQDQQAAIEALRQRSFANDAERNRAMSFEQFKDQGVDLKKMIN